MRMWCLPTKLLCRNHLLGEHKELHMLAGHIKKNKTMGRFLTDKLVNPQLINQRHSELVVEMTSRGYNHKSPLPKLVTSYQSDIDTKHNFIDLLDRCPACRLRAVENRINFEYVEAYSNGLIKISC